MSPFDFLLVAHLIGDFTLQTGWMALNKSKQWIPLIIHSLVYSLTITLIAWVSFGGLSLWGIILIFVAHVFLDKRIFTHWWVKNIMKSDPKGDWLTIVVDQVFHFIILMIAVLI